MKSNQAPRQQSTPFGPIRVDHLLLAAFAPVHPSPLLTEQARAGQVAAAAAPLEAANTAVDWQVLWKAWYHPSPVIVKFGVGALSLAAVAIIARSYLSRRR